MKPEMRFGDYKGNWSNTPINKLLTFNNGINAPKESYGHGRKFINVLDILNNNYVVYENIMDSVSVDAKQEETSKVEYGDMLFLRSSETREDVGKSTTYLDKNEFALFGGFVIRGKKTGNYNPYFLKLLLDTSSARNQISSKAGGSTRYNVSQSILNTVELFMPDNQEQEKIASFFMLLDKKNAKQQEKIEKLEELKKGMMRKVFSREIRFKDENGEEFPNWKAIRFEDVVEKLIGGGTPSRKVEEYYDGGIPWVTVKDLKANKYISDAEEYITELGLKNSSSKIVNKGDLIIPTRMAVGRILIAKEDVAINQDLKGCKLKTGYDTEFIYYLYTSRSAAIERLGSGSTVTGISIDDLMKIKLEVPTLKEQERIAKYLCSIDIKLEKEKSKFKLLAEQKKGFMRRMFV